MPSLLYLVRFILIIDCIWVTAVNLNHKPGNDIEELSSNLNIDRPFQKSKIKLRAPLQSPNYGDISRGEISENSETSASEYKASQTNQKSSDGETKNVKIVSFTEILYTADVQKVMLKDNYEVPMGIKLKEDCVEGVTFVFKDTVMKDMAEHFEAKCDVANKTQIKMKLIENFADNVIQKLDQIILILQAEDKDRNIKSETVIWMNVFTEASEKEKLTFEKPKYEIKSLVEYVGVVEQFKAKMTNDLSAIIKYSIASIDSDIKGSVTIDPYTGTFRIAKALEPRHYQIKIQANTADQKYSDSANVTLITSNMAVCNTKGLTFVYSLLTVQIPQGKLVQDVMKLEKQQNGCVYSMVSQKPAEGYFDLNDMTGSLNLKKEVFRSDQIFDNKKHEPKFVLEIAIHCNSKSKRSANDPSEKVDQEKNGKDRVDQTASILNNPKKLIVEVLINDEGPLVFPEPTLFFGYPQNYDIIEESLPSLLATVQVDRRNLKDDTNIRYEIEEKNCPFSIHPSSGNIYPCTYHKESDKLTFTVIAKRMDQDKVVAEAKTNITVFFLIPEQIVEIDLNEVDIASIDSPLRRLKTEPDFILKELSHTVLPQRETTKNNSETAKHLMKVYSYGFDTNRQTIVGGEVILKKLSSSPNVVGMEILQENSPNFTKKWDHRFWLSVIIVVSLIFGVFGGYLLYVRNRELLFGIMRLRHNDHTSTTPLENDIEGPSRTRWIHFSTNNAFSNEILSNSGPPYTDFRTRNEAFSFHNADATPDSNTNNYLDLPVSHYTNLSSFKPEVRGDERDTPLNVLNLQSEPTYSIVTPPERSVNAETQNNNVPILPVITLPPVSIGRNRRNRRISTETRIDNAANDSGISSISQ